MIYEVTAEPDGRFWLISAPAIGQVTQARNIEEIAVMAGELIELATGETKPALAVEFVNG